MNLCHVMIMPWCSCVAVDNTGVSCQVRRHKHATSLHRLGTHRPARWDVDGARLNGVDSIQECLQGVYVKVWVIITVN